MRFGVVGLKRPEAFPKTFCIYRSVSKTSETGRRRVSAPEPIGTAKCILSSIKPEEKERFHQMNVTVTHTIFHTGEPLAREEDFFVLKKEGKEDRYFRVQEVQNHGEMDIFTTYYCEERGDINGLSN